ncbi:hypothetical protein THOM_1884 [Trachipleistophora hominis]|uniref:Uncharacterized protein n=1 Tax=Trachipleistophora hominis TaxID=72359 RepID=L7JUS5_TRAHO|nr:hypothetical protein THOM_1884 [Trachipleistophora hominis]
MTQKQNISESSSTPSTKILNVSTELDTCVERSGPYLIPFLLAVFVIFILGLIFIIRRTKKFLKFSYPESLVLSTERQRNFTYDPSIVETNVFSIDRVEDEIDELMVDSIFDQIEHNPSYFAPSSNYITVFDEFPNSNLDESKIMPQAVQKPNEMLEDKSNSKDLEQEYVSRYSNIINSNTECISAFHNDDISFSSRK